ncbi:MAG: hypothetical protein ACKOHM_02060 [Spartobacteria bacterium]
MIRLRELGFKAERPKPGELKKVRAYDNLGGIEEALGLSLRCGDPMCFTAPFEKEAGSNGISPEWSETPWVLLGTPKAGIDRFLNSESFSMALLNLKRSTQVSDPLTVGLYSASREDRPSD